MFLGHEMRKENPRGDERRAGSETNKRRRESHIIEGLAVKSAIACGDHASPHRIPDTDTT
jgi:hypothetical protein